MTDEPGQVIRAADQPGQVIRAADQPGRASRAADEPGRAVIVANDGAMTHGGVGPMPAPAEEPEVVLLCGAFETAPGWTSPVLAGLPECAAVTPTDELRQVVGLLTAELRDPRPATDAVVPALLETMLAYLLRHQLAGEPGVLRDPAVGAALRLIHADPARRWTVAELAAGTALSRAAFARRFTARVGVPPLAYLTWWRMTLAARWLREGDETVAVTARRAGYTNEFAFATAFRRRHGTPPGRYRRASRGT